MPKIPLPGMRAVKTALAVALLFILFWLIYPDGWRQGAGLTSMAAVVCMQDSVDKTIRTGINRLIGTFVGSVFACLISLMQLDSINFFLWVAVSFAAIVVLIYVLNLIRRPESASVGCFVYIIIICGNIGATNNIFEYSAMRLLDTVIAIIVATAINQFIFPPKKKEKDQPKPA